MWNSPITEIVDIVEQEIKDNCMTIAHKHGFIVDEKRLVEILRGSKNEYEKGYEDGSIDALRYLIADGVLPKDLEWHGKRVLEEGRTEP